MADANANIIVVTISAIYVSCVGKLCITISAPKLEPEVYEIIGVNLDGKWIVEQIL